MSLGLEDSKSGFDVFFRCHVQFSWFLEAFFFYAVMSRTFISSFFSFSHAGYTMFIQFTLNPILAWSFVLVDFNNVK